MDLPMDRLSERLICIKFALVALCCLDDEASYFAT